MSEAACRPCWLLLPRWLHGSAPPGQRRRLGRRFLSDVCRAQHSLFLHVRLHDDLFDGQAADPRLVYAGDLHLLASVRTFAPHVDARFWPLFVEALDTSIRAILEADARQRRATFTPTARDLDLYARVGEIFKLASIAVCLALRRDRLLPAVGAFLDEIVVISQVFDDLVDAGEDWHEGRTNFAVGWLTPRPRAGQRRVRTRGRSRTFPVSLPGARRLVAHLRRRAARARAAATHLGPPAEAYAAQVTQHVEALDRALHRAHAAAVFRPVMTRRPA